MIVIRTAEDMARALDSPFDSELRELLQAHSDRLTQWGEYAFQDLAIFIIFEQGDELVAVETALCRRLVVAGAFALTPEVLTEHDGWTEVIFILSDDGFGLVLFIEEGDNIDPFLKAARLKHSEHTNSIGSDQVGSR